MSNREHRVTGAMALSFAVGSTCFVVGPLPHYIDLVGPTAGAMTFFVGSIFFTVGGALQTSLAAPDRAASRAGRAGGWAALVQSAGTLFFNASTFRALSVTISDPHYDKLVWRPDAFGSICFLISGVIAYRASPRHGLRPRRDAHGWWEPAVNLLGCIFFGIAAVAGYLVPSTGTMIDLAAANWNTAAGAACFLACALATLRTGRTSKSPRLPRLHALEHAVEHEVESIV